MAKQRGIVQLSGRVDNLCYYQQKRVRGGLVRRINLAMSDRVKVGSEYQRLRSANSYFGGCSVCASIILNMTGTRAKFLHLSDRQAVLTKILYQYQIDQNGGFDVDDIVFSNQDSYTLPYRYDLIVKNKMSKYLPSVPYNVYNQAVDSAVTITIPAFELENYCLYNNCIGILFTLVTDCHIYSVYRSSDTGKFTNFSSGYKVRREPLVWDKGTGDFTFSFNSGSIDDTFSFAILCALPIIRKVGGRAVTKDTGATCRMIGMLFP